MNRTNYHLTIKENNQDFYFHKEFISTGDIVKIGGYRTVVIHKQYDSPYTELTASLVNEGETIIRNDELR
ncbi:hypothetical protein CS562_14465 [Paenibacillus sp. LK1]|nr:hypothetical protein CS562_14465 [Paenibacillus sp. LK1]